MDKSNQNIILSGGAIGGVNGGANEIGIFKIERLVKTCNLGIGFPNCIKL
jgi:hypothetical protein